jgi:type II secretory pathway predicted ATPase ExeA
LYEAFYDLQTRPFQLTSDPRFFFSSRGHRRAVACLVYGARQGEGFIVITGEIGSGKTMLAATLAQRLAPSNLVVGQIVSTRLGPEGDRLLLLGRLEQLHAFTGKEVASVIGELQQELAPPAAQFSPAEVG